jgi:hypothetical protein
MLAAVTTTLQRWPIIGRRSELEVFEKALCSGEQVGLVIHGRPGVGKTRLADECLQWAAASGYPTERVVGSRTTAFLPLGAVAGLLAGALGRPGPDGQVNSVALFEDTRRALLARYEGHRLVTVADDVTLLDAASLALLGYLAVQGTIFLIATVRTGDPVPDLLTDLWRDGRAARIDLQDLSRTQLDTLLHLALAGPIEIGAGRELWEITEGNPLYVHELVLGALESGVLETIAPADVLESLERPGLIAVTNWEVRLAHPLHGEVVRAAVPRLRTRGILLAEADRLEASHPDPGPAALRIAVWRLDAGGQPDPAILVRGAHLARRARLPPRAQADRGGARRKGRRGRRAAPGRGAVRDGRV